MVTPLSLPLSFSLYLRWTRESLKTREAAVAWLIAPLPLNTLTPTQLADTQAARELAAALEPGLVGIDFGGKVRVAEAAAKAVIQGAAATVYEALLLRGKQEAAKIPGRTPSLEEVEEACQDLLRRWVSTGGSTLKPDVIVQWSAPQVGGLLRKSVRNRIIEAYRQRVAATLTHSNQQGPGPGWDDQQKGANQGAHDGPPQHVPRLLLSEVNDPGDQSDDEAESVDEKLILAEQRRNAEQIFETMIVRFGADAGIPAADPEGKAYTAAGRAQLARFREGWADDLRELREIVASDTSITAYHTAKLAGHPSKDIAAAIVAKTRAYSRARLKFHEAAAPTDSPLFDADVRPTTRVAMRQKFDERYRLNLVSETQQTERTESGKLQ